MEEDEIVNMDIDTDNTIDPIDDSLPENRKEFQNNNNNNNNNNENNNNIHNEINNNNLSSNQRDVFILCNRIQNQLLFSQDLERLYEND
jgi:hypothetical protein